MFSRSAAQSTRVIARGFASSARAERKVAVLGAAGQSLKYGRDRQGGALGVEEGASLWGL